MVLGRASAVVASACRRGICFPTRRATVTAPLSLTIASRRCPSPRAPTPLRPLGLFLAWALEESEFASTLRELMDLVVIEELPTPAAP